jgi:hypothetical protein
LQATERTLGENRRVERQIQLETLGQKLMERHRSGGHGRRAYVKNHHGIIP